MLETLEVLMVRDPSDGQSVTCRLPKLQQLIISHNEGAVNHLKSKCPPTCKVITDSSAFIQIMTKNAESYPYPAIAGCFKGSDFFSEVYETDSYYYDSDGEYHCYEEDTDVYYHNDIDYYNYFCDYEADSY